MTINPRTTILLVGLDRPGRAPYVAPRVTVIGTLADITQVKAFNASDGASFFGASEGPIS